MAAGILSCSWLFLSGLTSAQTVNEDFNQDVGGEVYALAVQADGKILVGGRFSTLSGQARSLVGRLNSVGNLEESFNPGAGGGSSPSVYCLAVQSDGKIIVGGNFTTLGGQASSRIGRLNSDGSLDSNLAAADFLIYALAVQADGKIVVGGQFTMLGGQTRNYLGRLNTDLSLDTSFNSSVGGPTPVVYSLAVQPDGKILVGGNFASLGGQSRANIGRLNADGSLDNNFNPGANRWVTCLAAQADGKILIGGSFTTLGGQDVARLGRLNENGSLDTSFNPGADDIVLSLAVQADGKILVGGDFLSLGNQSRNRIGRLNADGSLDNSFNPGASWTVNGLMLQPDGKILVGEDFSFHRFNNTTAANQDLSYDGSRIQWQRIGSGPEVWRTSFEITTNGVDWIDLGAGTRVSGGWESPLVALPTRFTIRARGYAAGGYGNSSSWFVETLTQIGMEFRITDISIAPNGTVKLTHNADTNFYYILYRGSEITNIGSATDMAMGTNNIGALVDSIPASGTNNAFYRVLQVRLDQPLDSDGNGIDDVYELRHRSFLNPLNAADALQDFDRDGLSNLQEYRAGTDPTVNQYLAPVVLATVGFTRETSVTLTGTAQPKWLIKVDGGSVAVTNAVNGDGTFAINVPLNLNRLNRIFVSAIDPNGHSSSPQPVEILQDSEPPSLLVEFPADNAEVTASSMVIAGRVRDLLTGHLGIGVLVNGQPAHVNVGQGNSGTFERGVELELGTNILTVVASDALGNSTTNQITLHRIPLSGSRLVLVSGDGQGTNVYGRLAQPVVVKATQTDGNSPLPNQVIKLDVTRSDGRLLPLDPATLADISSFSNAVDRTDNGVMHLTLIADANGEARAWWTLGGDAGYGNNRLSVSAPGISNALYLSASADPGPVSQINVGSGDNQRGEINSPSREPLIAWVSDSYNGVPNIPVTFTVTQGGGKLFPIAGAVGPGGGVSSLTANSTVTGHAQVYFVLGPEPGPNIIEANYPGNTNLPATFIIYGVARDSTKNTTFVGLVLDNSSQPIGGAWVRLLYPSPQGNVPRFSTYTDAQGQFSFTNALPGPAQLNIVGRLAMSLGGNPIPPNSFPEFSINTTVIPNAENSLTTPLLLPRLNPKNAKLYYGTNDLVLTCEGIDGFKITIRANSMHDPNGAAVTPNHPITLSLNQVHQDSAPFPIPNGASPPFIWMLQPAGATFDPPLEIEHPNMNALPAGAVSYVQSYNPDSERFEVITSGHVQDDSSTLVSDPHLAQTSVSSRRQVQGEGPNSGPHLNVDITKLVGPISFWWGRSVPTGNVQRTCDITMVAFEVDGKSNVIVGTNDTVHFAISQLLSRNCSNPIYYWEFGDGETQYDTNQNTTHQYKQATTFKPRVTAYCQDCLSAVKSSDSAEVIVTALNLVVHNPKVIDPGESEIPNDVKLTKGAQTFVNLDNDDQGIKFDLDDVTVTGENEMIKVTVQLLNKDASQGIVKLAAITGGGDIKLWKADNKATEYALGSALAVPADFTPVGDKLELTLYAEGIAAQHSQQGTKLRVTYDKSSACKDEVALTTIGLDSITWEGINNSNNDDNTLDIDPNWKLGVPGSLRVFPDARLDGRLGGVGSPRDRVTVRAALSVAPVEPVKVYFRSFDVDDPNASADAVDDETAAEDNRGTAPAKAGKIEGSDANGILEQTFNSQVESFRFQVTMQPGDNFRIVGNGDKDFIARLENDDSFLGPNDNDKQRIIDPKVTGTAADKEVRDAGRYCSQVLTVWRNLHVEVDAMGAPVNNFQEGNITSLDTGDSATATRVTVSLSPRDGSSDLDSAPPHNGRFENGKMTIASIHSVSPLDGNGQKDFRRTAGLNICASALPFEAKDNSFVVHSTMSGTVTRITGGSLVLNVNITAHSDSIINWPSFVGGTARIGGGPWMPITAVDSVLNQITVSGLQIPYHVEDDDSAAALGLPDTSKLEEAFAPAYVRPLFDAGTSETNLKFIANIASDDAADVRKGWSFKASGSEADNTFWTVYLRGSWQHTTDSDGDPNDEGAVYGIVDNINGQGANIYKEVLRAAEFTPIPAQGISEAYTTAHEVGHLFNGLHPDGGLMEQSLTRASPKFSDVTLDKIRKINHP